MSSTQEVENAFSFASKVEDRARLQRALVGKVIIQGSSYNMQVALEMEGYYAIKVTPLGESLCLLEETQEGFLADIFGKEETWWGKFCGGEELD